jgi:gluconate kinase
MSAALLESQFATLEEPKDAVTVSVNQSLTDVVAELLRQTKLAG